MKAVTLRADWDPKKDFELGKKDVDGKLTYLGSDVWRNPRVEIVEKPKPELLKPSEVIVRVKACGICGSDVHMAQQDNKGYIFYPGLTAFPCTLGHEFSGIVVEAGKKAINGRTNKRFAVGEPVTSEEMLWCGECDPCRYGFPNHCERLQELGFSVDGALAKYIKVEAKYLWSLKSLEESYGKGTRLFLAGSLTEPTSVAYNAVIVRGGGIWPGDDVVIHGGGPIGLAACAILKTAGAHRVILSEPFEPRARIGRQLGATHIINPFEEDVVERILDITEGQGAKLHLEATGAFKEVWPTIEDCMWRQRQINSTAALVARMPDTITLKPEVLQVRRDGVAGSQGHSGHGIFPRVIKMMASGMDMLPLITKKISLEEVPENLKLLQTDKENCKITIIP